MNRVAQVLAAVERLRSLDHPSRTFAVTEGLLSRPMVDHVFACTLDRYTPHAVDALASSRFAGDIVGVGLARSVATAPLRAIALPWLAGADAVHVRASRHQQGLVRAFVAAFDDPRITVTTDLDGVDHAIVYGRDETVRAWASTLPLAVGFEGFGHGFGVTYLDAPTEAAAGALALDVARYDQRGCLSPQCVFVRGEARGFARALHEALGALEVTLPRGALDAGEGAAVMQWQGVQMAQCGWFRRGAAHAVGSREEPVRVGSPGGRNVVVVGVPGLDAVGELLADECAHVSVLATDRGEQSLWPWCRGRIVAVGAMQDPPLDGPEDARGPTRR